MSKVISDNKGCGNPNRISYGHTAGDGFKYVLKHGLGPDTLPEDVGLIRVQEWDNGYTFIWTDRVLSAEELSKYDIPSETELGKYEAKLSA